MSIITQASNSAALPTLPSSGLRVTIQNIKTGKYAARGGSHWTSVTEPTTLLVMPDSQNRPYDGAIHHIRAENESKFMRHYSGDADNFTQSNTDRDTAWKFEASSRGHTIVNLSRSGNGYLAIHSEGKLYVPSDGEMGDASAREWKITWLDDTQTASESKV